VSGKVLTHYYPTLLVGPPPVAEAAHTARIMALCHAIAAVAQELGVPYLPVCERLVQTQTWVQEAAQSDGAHPRQVATRPWRRWCRHGLHGGLPRRYSLALSHALTALASEGCLPRIARSEPEEHSI
jgi:hypothetical protein